VAVAIAEARGERRSFMLCNPATHKSPAITSCNSVRRMRLTPVARSGRARRGGPAPAPGRRSIRLLSNNHLEFRNLTKRMSTTYDDHI